MDINGYNPEVSSESFHFDPERAARAVYFIENHCRHIKGKWAGDCVHLEPWERSIVEAIFGWVDDKGKRRYQTVFVYVPRKNGKSLLIACISLYMLVVDDEPGAECYAAAADRQQAALLFDVAKNMVLRDEVMAEDITVFKHALERRETNSIFKTISAEGSTKHGFNSSFVCIDELHAQKTPELVDVLCTSTGSREQPLIVFITTADYLRESVCNDKYEYACNVRDGIWEDSRFLPCIWEATQEDDWTSPETWKKANPNYGVSISEDYLQRQCQIAQNDTTYRNTFMRLHLNVRTNTSLAWIDLNKWDLVKGIEPEYDGQYCYAGLDLGITRDMTALALCWNTDDGLGVKLWYWIPEKQLTERERRDKVPMLKWCQDGHVIRTKGNATDFNQVGKEVANICYEYNVKELVYDQAFATQMAQGLHDDYGIKCLTFPQTVNNFNEPIRELERLLNTSKLLHGGNPVLRWNAASTMLREDLSGRVRPDKVNSTGRIDGLVATLMALGRMISTKEFSQYEDGGMLVL